MLKKTTPSLKKNMQAKDQRPLEKKPASSNTKNAQTKEMKNAGKACVMKTKAARDVPSERY